MRVVTAAVQPWAIVNTLVVIGSMWLAASLPLGAMMGRLLRRRDDG